MSVVPSLGPADIDYAIRAILPLPPEDWEAAAELLVRSAALAGRIRRVRGRSHPALGNGSLSAVVSRWPLQTPPETDPIRIAEALGALSRAVIRVSRSGSGAGGAAVSSRTDLFAAIGATGRSGSHPFA